jgi:hypothetical protein
MTREPERSLDRRARPVVVGRHQVGVGAQQHGRAVPEVLDPTLVVASRLPLLKRQQATTSDP